jgi:hypothetical protein
VLALVCVCVWMPRTREETPFLRIVDIYVESINISSLEKVMVIQGSKVIFFPVRKQKNSERERESE